MAILYATISCFIFIVNFKNEVPSMTAILSWIFSNSLNEKIIFLKLLRLCSGILICALIPSEAI